MLRNDGLSLCSASYTMRISTGHCLSPSLSVFLKEKQCLLNGDVSRCLGVGPVVLDEASVAPVGDSAT